MRAQLGRALQAPLLAMALGGLYPSAALAHDTWFASRSTAPPPGNLVFALGTGNLFPQQEFPVDQAYVQTRGCRQGGRDLPLTPLANTSTALLLQTRVPGAGPVTCWAQLVPFEVTLEPDKIALYLDEINASDALRQTWAAMQARGLRWTEQYVKNARVEVAGAPATAATAASAAAAGAVAASASAGDTPAAAARAVPMAMDVLLEGGLHARRAGEPLVFQVLRNGKPLAGFAIELRGSAHDSGQWLRTDAQGRVVTTTPAAGKWVLRGTDLRLSPQNADVWQSDFINLAFDVR